MKTNKEPWENPGQESCILARLVVAVRQRDVAEIEAVKTEFQAFGEWIEMAYIKLMTEA